LLSIHVHTRTTHTLPCFFPCSLRRGGKPSLSRLVTATRHQLLTALGPFLLQLCRRPRSASVRARKGVCDGELCRQQGGPMSSRALNPGCVRLSEDWIMSTTSQLLQSHSCMISRWRYQVGLGSREPIRPVALPAPRCEFRISRIFLCGFSSSIYMHCCLDQEFENATSVFRSGAASTFTRRHITRRAIRVRPAARPSCRCKFSSS
jgi:hypothetical protein